MNVARRHHHVPHPYIFEYKKELSFLSLVALYSCLFYVRFLLDAYNATLRRGPADDPHSSVHPELLLDADFFIHFKTSFFITKLIGKILYQSASCSVGRTSAATAASSLTIYNSHKSSFQKIHKTKTKTKIIFVYFSYKITGCSQRNLTTLKTT